MRFGNADEIFRTSVFRLAKIAPSSAFAFRRIGTFFLTRGEGRSPLQFDPAQRRAHDLRSPWAIRATQGSRAMTVQEKPYPVVSLVVDIFRRMAEAPARAEGNARDGRRQFRPDRQRIADVFRRSGGAGPPGAACRRRAAEDAGRARHRPGRSGAERAPRAARHGTRLLAVQPQAPVRPRSRRRHRRCALSKNIAAMPTRSTVLARG